MKITFSDNAIGEYQRLLYTLYNLETGFFKKSGMPLSYKEDGGVNTVLLPKYEEIQSKKFWKKFKIYKKIIPDKYVSFNGTEFSDLYQKILKEKPAEISKIAKAWRIREKDFFKILDSLFESDNTPIEVYVTKYGTVSSYNSLSSTLKIYLRQDADISQIAFCATSYFIHKYKIKMTWEEQQRIADFLFLNTKLNKIFPKYKSLIDFARNPEKNNIMPSESNQVYEDLGLKLQNVFTLKKGFVIMNRKPLNTLTCQEEKVLIKLIQNRNNITTFEELSEVLWGGDFSNFSLQAISKVIERLRDKLFKNSLHRQAIFTKRKRGYLLID